MTTSTASSKRPLRGIVFDMDGTLTTPNLDFAEMYKRCGVAPSDDLLEAVSKMDDAGQAKAHKVIENMEDEGRRTLNLEPGVLELADWLRFHKVPCALVTRNSALSVEHFMIRLWSPLGLPPLSPAISRDDALPPKPDPAALKAIAEDWKASPSELLMVGDSPSNDVVFGKRFGCATALVDSGRKHLEVEAGKTLESPGELDLFLWSSFSPFIAPFLHSSKMLFVSNSDFVSRFPHRQSRSAPTPAMAELRHGP